MEIAALGLTVRSDGLVTGTQRLEKLEGQARRTEGATERMGRSALRAAGAFAAMAAVTFSFSSIISQARDFNAAMAEVSTLLPNVPAQIDEITDASRRLATEFGGTASAQAMAFYQAISAGAGDAAAATKLLEVANRTAIGGVTDVTIAVDVLTTAQNAYAASGLTAADAADTLFVGMKAGKTTVGQLARSLGRVIPQATAVGLSFDEIVAATAALTTQGQSTNMAVTGLSGIMTQLLKPSARAVELAEQLGIEFTATKAATMGLSGFMEYLVEAAGGSQEVLAELFGSTESLRAVFSLAGQGGVKFNEILGQMENRTGAADEAFEKVSRSLDQRLNVAVAKFGDMALQAGTASLNVLVPAMEGLLSAVDFLTDNVDLLIVASAAAATAIGGPFAIAVGATAVKAVTAGVASLLMYTASLGATSVASAAAILSMNALRAAVTVLLGPVGIAVAIVGSLTAALLMQGRETQRLEAIQREYADRLAAANAASETARQRLEDFRVKTGEVSAKVDEATGKISAFTGAVRELTSTGVFSWLQDVNEQYGVQAQMLRQVQQEQSASGIQGAALAEAQAAKAEELSDAFLAQEKVRAELNKQIEKQAELESSLAAAQRSVQPSGTLIASISSELEQQRGIVTSVRAAFAQYDATLKSIQQTNVDAFAGEALAEQEAAAAAVAEKVQETITSLQDRLTIDSQVNDLQKEIASNILKAGLALTDQSAGAEEIRRITAELFRLDEARTKEAERLEQAKNASDTISDLEVEVDQLTRLHAALRLGDEAYMAVAEAIAIEDIVRRNGLEGLDAEIERIRELVRQRGFLSGAIATIQDGMGGGGISEADRTRSRERFEDLGTDLRDAEDNPLVRLEQEYQERLKIVEAYEKAYTDKTAEAAAARLEIERQYRDSQVRLSLVAGEQAFGAIAGALRDTLGEQSAAYKAMFAVQQAFVIATASLNIAKAMSEALALPFPANLAAWGLVLSNAATIMSAVNSVALGFQSGGFTGMGGVSQVAGVVHGQEFVAHAEATRRWRPQLEAMNAGTYRPANDNTGSGRVAVEVMVSVDDDGRLQAYVARGMNEAVNASVTISDQRTKAQMGAAAKEARRPVISARA